MHNQLHNIKLLRIPTFQFFMPKAMFGREDIFVCVAWYKEQAKWADRYVYEVYVAAGDTNGLFVCVFRDAITCRTADREEIERNILWDMMSSEKFLANLRNYLQEEAPLESIVSLGK